MQAVYCQIGLKRFFLMDAVSAVNCNDWVRVGMFKVGFDENLSYGISVSEFHLISKSCYERHTAVVTKWALPLSCGYKSADGTH